MDDGLLRDARELIAESFVLDAHFDLALDLDDRREQGMTHVY